MKPSNRCECWWETRKKGILSFPWSHNTFLLTRRYKPLGMTFPGKKMTKVVFPWTTHQVGRSQAFEAHVATWQDRCSLSKLNGTKEWSCWCYPSGDFGECFSFDEETTYKQYVQSPLARFLTNPEGFWSGEWGTICWKLKALQQIVTRDDDCFKITLFSVIICFLSNKTNIQS